MSDNLVGRSEHLDLAVAKPQTAMTQPPEASHLVIYHDHGMARSGGRLDLIGDFSRTTRETTLTGFEPVLSP
jgi:hypothetical protein